MSSKEFGGVRRSLSEVAVDGPITPSIGEPSYREKVVHAQVQIEAISKLERDLYRTIDRLFPVGTHVRWHERPYFKTGAIAHPAAGRMLQVREDYSKRMVRVHVQNVIDTELRPPD